MENIIFMHVDVGMSAMWMRMEDLEWMDAVLGAAMTELHKIKQTINYSMRFQYLVFEWCFSHLTPFYRMMNANIKWE